MTPEATTSSRNRCPEPANSDPTASWMRAPARVQQPHERHPLGQRQLAQARDLQLAGHAHRPGHDREVVGGDGDHPAVDLAVAGDDAVGGRVLVLQAAHGVVDAGVQAELDERARVHQQVDALARGQRALVVLAGDPLLAAAQARGGAALGEVLDQRAQQSDGALRRSRQGLEDRQDGARRGPATEAMVTTDDLVAPGDGGQQVAQLAGGRAAGRRRERATGSRR